MLGRGVDEARGLAAARREELDARGRKRSEGAGLTDARPGRCEGTGKLEGFGILDGRGIPEGRGMPEGRGRRDEESIGVGRPIREGLGCWR